ncbi:3-phosphoshikimate 1-carboxyvinyltransferase [Candidatus Zixiibacteriota bacterium]
MKLTIKPTRRVHGRFRFPPANELAQRAAILSLLCAGKSTINNWPDNQVATTTLDCVRRLGAEVTIDGSVVQIDGKNPADLSTDRVVLNCPGAFTSYWLLAGLLAGLKSSATLTGDVSPVVRTAVIDVLTEMGTIVESEKENDGQLKFSPAILRGALIKTTSVLPVVKHVAMTAALFAASPTEITEDLALPDSLERIFPAYGIDPTITRPERPLSRRERMLNADQALKEPEKFHKRITIVPDASALRPVDWVLPGDFSLAAPLIAAAAVRPAGEIVIEDIGLNSTRTGLLKILKRMGAEITTQRRRMENGEPVGDISVEGTTLRATKVSPSEIPSLVGQLPLIAVAAGSAVGVTVIRGAKELQDAGLLSFTTITENLRTMGVKVAELEDGWAIEGPTEWHAAEIDGAGDTDVGMAFAVAGLSGEKDTIIDNADDILTRFPDLQKILAELA